MDIEVQPLSPARWPDLKAVFQAGRGVANALLDGAIEVARRRGVRILEACPVDKPGRVSPETLWFGTAGMYLRAGFQEIARRKATRAVVRLDLDAR